MCFNNKYKNRTIHGGCYQIIKKLKQTDMENKHSLKDCIEQFFDFSYKNICDKILLFDATLLAQKNTMWGEGGVTLNKVLNNYGITV